MKQPDDWTEEEAAEWYAQQVCANCGDARSQHHDNGKCCWGTAMFFRPSTAPAPTTAESHGETGTPRTDSALVQVDVSYFNGEGLSSYQEQYVEPDFARTIERETQQLRADLAEARAQLAKSDWANMVIACNEAGVLNAEELVIHCRDVRSHLSGAFATIERVKAERDDLRAQLAQVTADRDALREALEAEAMADKAYAAAEELNQSAAEEGWSNDSTGSGHISEAYKKAEEMRDRAIRLRNAALRSAPVAEEKPKAETKHCGIPECIWGVAGDFMDLTKDMRDYCKCSKCVAEEKGGAE